MHSVTIVTPDIMGPVKNGGIGTAFYYLARLLSKNGHQVQILFCPLEPVEIHLIEEWQKYYAQYSISLILLDSCDVPEVVITQNAKRSYLVYQRLKTIKSDFIHFADYRGLSYYTLLAKKNNLHFADSKITVHLHGSLLWHLEGSRRYAESIDEIEIIFLEKSSILMADALISPSSYMLDWASKSNLVCDQETFVIAHPSLVDVEQNSKINSIDYEKINKICFVGRFENRKGIKEFWTAIDFLPTHFEVVLYGKHGTIDGIPSNDWINSFQLNTDRKISFVSDFSHVQILEVLKKKDSLIVAPSLLENLPYIVFEAISLGVPIMWTRRGGTEEIFADQSADTFAIEPNFESILSTLEKVLSSKPLLGVLSQKFLLSDSEWINFHKSKNIKAKSDFHISDSEFNPVNVIIATRNRPEHLVECLKGFLKQTYKEFNILLVDDGSTEENRLKYRSILEGFKSDLNLKYFPVNLNSPAASRNFGAKNASSNFIVFFDDDNIPYENFLESLILVKLNLKCDIATCGYKIVQSGGENHDKIWIPLGSCSELGAFHNVFSDTVALMSVEMFNEIGGFADLSANEDWDFFWKASRMKKSIGVFPDTLFTYTQHQSNRSNNLLFGIESRAELVRNFIDEMPTSLRNSYSALFYTYRRSHFASHQVNPNRYEAEVARLNDQSQIIPLKIGDTSCLFWYEMDSRILVHSVDGDSQMVFESEFRNAKKAIFLIQIECEVQSQIQIYTQDFDDHEAIDKQVYRESSVLHYIVSKGQNSIAVDVSSKNLTHIRIDFGDLGGNYVLSKPLLKIENGIPINFRPVFWRELEPKPFPGITWNTHSILWSLISFENLKKIEFDNNEGKLQFDSLTNDPKILFSWNSDFSTSKTVFLEIEMHSELRSEFVLFEQIEEKAKAIEVIRFKRVIQIGKNHFWIRIEPKASLQKFRIDPISALGRFTMVTIKIVSLLEE